MSILENGLDSDIHNFFSTMKRLLFCVSIALLSQAGYGQNRAFLDSIISMPYDEMVADLGSSEKALKKALLMVEKLEQDTSEAAIRSQLSTVTYLLGNHEESLDQGIKAISLFEKNNEIVKAGALYCSIGYQMKRRDLEKANSFMWLGLEMLESTNETAALSAAYNNYGVLKEMEENLDSADFYYREGLRLVESLQDSIGIPYSLNNVAGIHILRQEYDQAEGLLIRASQIRKARNDDYGILENLILFGDLYDAKNNPIAATPYYKQAVDKSYRVGFPYMRQYCFEQLAKAYEKRGKIDSSLTFYKAYTALKDSLLEEQRTESLAEMETRFETALKQKENLELKQEKQEQQLVVSRQRNWIFGLVGATLTILFLALFLIQRNKQKEAEKRDAAIIEERERGLRSIIQATEDERKRIAKDLHDGIVQSLTGLSLKIQKQASSKKAKESGIDEGLQETRGTLDEAIAEVRGISHQMMPRVLSEMGLIPAMDDMLSKSLGMTDIKYEFEHHNVEDIRFEENVEISLYRITQELINNIIKHSQAKAVSVQLLKTKSHLVLIVEDNGTGFEFEDPSNQNGIGLMNISSRAKAIHGDVNYEPSPQQGTVATVRVPIK